MAEKEHLFSQKPFKEVDCFAKEYFNRFCTHSIFSKLNSIISGYPEAVSVSRIIEKIDEEDFWIIRLGLPKEPSKRNLKKLQNGYKGVKLNYMVSGEIIPLADN